MKKIAVGDIGEFWYGDYKEPFVQLEGAVTGYPQGTLLKADDGKLLCAYCGKTFDNLAHHVLGRHGMKAKDFKAEVGLLQKSALVSDRMRLTRVANGKRLQASGLAWSITPGNPDQIHAPGRRGDDSPNRTPEYLNKTGRCYEQVLQTARTIMRENRGRLGAPSLRKHGIGPMTVQRYFGSLDGLRRTVGARIERPMRMWTDAQLLAVLRNLAMDLGRTPTRSDIARYGLPNQVTYAKHFGSYTEACKRAGLDPNLPVAITGQIEVAALNAYAVTGSLPGALEALRRQGIILGQHVVQAMFHRYGFPLSTERSYEAKQARKEWAAEMAKRLAA